MAATATITKPEPSARELKRRRTLAEELVAIHVKHKAVFDRIDAIKAQLKEIASDGAASFRELFDKGVVKVSPGHEGKFKGAFPTVDEKVFFELPDTKRTELEKAGIVKVVPTWGNPYYGSIAVEVF